MVAHMPIWFSRKLQLQILFFLNLIYLVILKYMFTKAQFLTLLRFEYFNKDRKKLDARREQQDVFRLSAPSSRL